MTNEFIGFLPGFQWNESQQDWPLYLETIEQFFETNKIPDDIRTGLFLIMIDQHSYKIVRDACRHVIPKDKTYTELCTILNKWFSVKKSVFCVRHKFYNARQRRNENINNWLIRIKELAIDCKFGAEYNSILLDRFVSGISSAQILDKLEEFQEGKLTLERAVEIAVKKEYTMKYFKQKQHNK